MAFAQFYKQKSWLELSFGELDETYNYLNNVPYQVIAVVVYFFLYLGYMYLDNYVCHENFYISSDHPVSIFIFLISFK